MVDTVCHTDHTSLVVHSLVIDPKDLELDRDQVPNQRLRSTDWGRHTLTRYLDTQTADIVGRHEQKIVDSVDHPLELDNVGRLLQKRIGRLLGIENTLGRPFGGTLDRLDASCLLVTGAWGLKGVSGPRTERNVAPLLPHEVLDHHASQVDHKVQDILVGMQHYLYQEEAHLHLGSLPWP